MNRIILLLFFLLATNCGGGRKLSDHPQPLGVVPFASDALAGSNVDLNHKLLRALHYQGSFLVQVVQRESVLLDLEQMHHRFGLQVSGDDSLYTSNAMRDSLTGAGGSLPRFLLTGAFTKEIEYDKRGQLVPFLFYAPSHRIVAELEYRLYDRQERRWVAMRRIEAEVKHSGGKQVVDYDPSDPSLAVSALKRQQLREQLYQKLFAKLATDIGKLTRK